MNPNLGQVIKGGFKDRDAIHIAVAPVRAATPLKPGQHVGLVEPGSDYASYSAETLIGIVDPFLEKEVKEDQWFWLMLYPSTITGLRHEWSHPAFQDRPPSRPAPEPPGVKTTEAERWLRAFAEKCDISYDRVIRQGHAYKRGGDYFIAQGYNLHPGEDEARKYWRYWEIVTGEKAPEKAEYGDFPPPAPFSCSC